MIVNNSYCPPISTVLDPGYYANCTSSAYRSECSVSCTPGYYGTPTVSTCGADGSWSTISGCVPITCNGTALPPHSYVTNGRCTEADPFGSECVIACLSNYAQMSGGSSRTCDLEHSGSYPPSDLVCVPTCNALPLPNNTLSSSSTTCTSRDIHGTSCTLNCITGHYPANGDAVRTCNLQESGNYPPSNFNCTRMYTEYCFV